MSRVTFIGSERILDVIAISTDKSQLDVVKIHNYLFENSTWAKGIAFALVATSIENSMCFGAYSKGEQVGFARVITDYATFANLVDVIVWPEFQGQGIAKQLMNTIVNDRDLQQVRRFTLATSDAHGLYKQFKFKPLAKPDTFMEIYRPNIYQA